MLHSVYEANWNRRTGRQTDKPMYWEAAPPKILVTTQRGQSPPTVGRHNPKSNLQNKVDKVFITHPLHDDKYNQDWMHL